VTDPFCGFSLKKLLLPYFRLRIGIVIITGQGGNRTEPKKGSEIAAKCLLHEADQHCDE
jgi:hypothetical protein